MAEFLCDWPIRIAKQIEIDGFGDVLNEPSLFVAAEMIFNLIYVIGKMHQWL
jgi:hypothetical protein